MLDLQGVVGNQAILPMVEPSGGAARRPRSDVPVRRRVSRSDIAGRSRSTAEWSSQFPPQKLSADPADVSSIEEAQAWVKDLSGFEREESRRYRIGAHLRSMIERLPPEVWLPSNEVIHESATEESSLVVTGAIGPIETDALRDKLFTAYLSIERPAELTDSDDPTGLHWAADIEPYVSPEEQAAAERFSLSPLLTPFRIDREAFTWREIDVLEFLFPDEMLEWRRRDVAVQESVARERDRRTGVFMAALGDASIRFVGSAFKFSALAALGSASAPFVAGRIGLGLGVRNFASAGWGMRSLIITGTGTVVGAGQGAVDSAVTNLPDVVSGDLSGSDYAGAVAAGTRTGAFWGGAFGVAGSVASPLLRGFRSLIRPTPGPGNPVQRAGTGLADDAAAVVPGQVPGRVPAPEPVSGPLIVDLQSGPQIGIHPQLPGFGRPNLLPRLVEASPGARGVAIESGDWLIGYPVTRQSLHGEAPFRIPGVSPTNSLDLRLSREIVQSTPHWPPHGSGAVGRALREWTDEGLATAPFTLQPWQIDPRAAFPRSGPVIVLTEPSGTPSAFFTPLGGRPGPGLPQRLVPINQTDVVGLQPSTHPALHGRVDQMYWRRPFALARAAPDVVTQMGEEANRMLRPGGFVELRVLASGDVQVARGLAAHITGARIVEVPSGAIRAYASSGTRPPGLTDEQWQILEAAGPDIRGELSQLGEGLFNRIVRVIKGS